MNIEELRNSNTQVTVWIGGAKYIGRITQVGVMPGHMARIGFSLKDKTGREFLITEECTIMVNPDTKTKQP